jgi:hypothetical protein
MLNRLSQGELEKSSTIEVKRILESVGLPTAVSPSLLISK